MTLETNMNNIVNTGTYFVQNGNENVKLNIQSQLDQLKERWDLVTSQATAQNNTLKSALVKSQKVI